ncbi:hypothetical protein OESDEN_20363, partial [Oesophagostomum dentatum]
MQALVLFLLAVNIASANEDTTKCDICKALDLVLHWGPSTIAPPMKRMEWRCDIYSTDEEKKTCKQVAKELFARKDVIEGAESKGSIA